jgi:hypothetical protein
MIDTPSEHEPDAAVVEEGERVAALLALSDVEMIQVESTGHPVIPGIVYGWSLQGGDSIEADVYLCLDLAAVQAVLAYLGSVIGPPGDDGLPAIGQNGRLVFSVRYVGSVDDRKAVYDALDVVGALSGEEE